MPEPLVRELFCARPKVGKTGATACLVNSGRYRVIVADFDGNPDILLNMVDPEHADKLIILPFEDKLKRVAETVQLGNSPISVTWDGTPKAWSRFLDFMDDGKATDLSGEKLKLGDPRTWEPDTVLQLDSLSAVSRSCFRRYIAAVNKNMQSKTFRDWGRVQEEIDSMLEKLTSRTMPYHLIVTAHLTMIGPKPLEEDDEKRQEKVDFNNEIKKEEIELLPTRYYPRSVGRKLSENLAEHFSAAILGEITEDGRRVISLKPSPVIDIGVPCKPGLLPKELPIDVGQLAIFNAVCRGEKWSGK